MSEGRIVSSGARDGSLRVPNGVSTETFVKILETPLRMTDIGIESVKLANKETIQINFVGGLSRTVNIGRDSKLQIICDIVDALK